MQIIKMEVSRTHKVLDLFLKSSCHSVTNLVIKKICLIKVKLAFIAKSKVPPSHSPLM